MKTYNITRKQECFACGYVTIFREIKEHTDYFPRTEYVVGDKVFLVSHISEGGNGGTHCYCSCPKCGTMKHIDFLYSKSETW